MTPRIRIRRAGPAVVADIEEPSIGFPTRLPDGRYTGR